LRLNKNGVIFVSRLLNYPDQAAAKRAFEAMMQMGKIDIAAIETARRG
jgi:predicted 3-demethylubiquinone-9 3-methyltransferase (glyoxalase superfamily)